VVLHEYSRDEVLERYRLLGEDLAKRNIDIDAVKDAVSRFEVEVPSWAFGPFGGGRFSGYIPPGAARNIFEKIEDAAMVNRLTGAAPKIGIHVGWDDPEGAPFDKIKPSSFKKVKDYAQGLDLEIGSVSPTYFLEGTEFGSLSSNDPETRKRMIEHTLTSAEVAEKYGIGLLTLWFPDGSLYPGQVDMRRRERNLKSSLKEIYDRTPDSVKMLIEYKLFEPGTYHTVVSDVSAASEIALWLGRRAGVIVDIGHHAHGVNIEHIVARLIEKGMPAGIHFNSRYVADDDHAVEPNMLIFRVFHELVKGGVIGSTEHSREWAYMIDQCSPIENRIEAVLHSVDSLMVSYAKALIVDVERLKRYQYKNEVIPANRVLVDAFLTDVRPILYMARLEKGLPIDPVEAYRESGYQEKIEKERSGGR